LVIASLDVSIRSDILKLMVAQEEKLGVTYVFITHDLSLAWVISDRIAVMYPGRIVCRPAATRVLDRGRGPPALDARHRWGATL